MSRVIKPAENLLLESVAAFRRAIRDQDIDVAVQKHITYGACCLLSPDVYFELKRAVAEEFAIHPNEVLVVGSAKLGFSIAPSKRYQLSEATLKSARVAWIGIRTG